MSHVKKFLSLKHGADFSKNSRFERFAVWRRNTHPRKLQYSQPDSWTIDSLELKENQETMIALFAFYSLGRKSEFMNLTVGDVVLVENENHILVDISRRKKREESKNTMFLEGYTCRGRCKSTFSLPLSHIKKFLSLKHGVRLGKLPESRPF
mmetsp:Transcript_5397/g.6944  ORF Transcript_5397/g.6944 Transcript_5397/m.6944 type:complete len:152 (-) Transcript_5397:63-518(-)